MFLQKKLLKTDSLKSNSCNNGSHGNEGRGGAASVGQDSEKSYSLPKGSDTRKYSSNILRRVQDKYWGIDTLSTLNGSRYNSSLPLSRENVKKSYP